MIFVSDDFPQRKGEADPLFLHSPTKKKILLKQYYPSPPPKKLYFAYICFFFKFCMYALMIVDTTPKVDQCSKAYLFLVSATPLSGGLFYYKGTKPVTPVPTGDDVKTPIQQRIQSTQH